MQNVIDFVEDLVELMFCAAAFGALYKVGVQLKSHSHGYCPASLMPNNSTEAGCFLE